jgi:Mrp family chromosome partitioning ATPase
VIAVADAMILANMTDGVLFVVKTGHTAKEVVKKAKNLLDGINAPLLGAVLNDLDLDDRAYRYHYYYSYYQRHGQYYEDSGAPEAAREAEQTSS